MRTAIKNGIPQHLLYGKKQDGDNIERCGQVTKTAIKLIRVASSALNGHTNRGDRFWQTLSHKPMSELLYFDPLSNFS